MTHRSDGFAYALRALARRDLSEAELRRKLASRQVPPEQTELILERLRGLGYLDDLRLARNQADAALRGDRSRGQRLRFDLTRRGIAEETVRQVMDELVPLYDEEESLRRLLERKFPGCIAGECTEKERLRVFRYLQRRGFTASAILKQFRSDEPA